MAKARDRWKILVIAAVALSCGGGATEPPVSLIRIEPVKAVFAPGEALFLRISNIDSVLYGANPCTATLELATEKGWIGVVTDFSCGDVGVLIPAGTSLEVQALFRPDITLPTTLSDGIYRAVIDVLPRNRTTSDRVASAPFRVTRTH